MTVLTLRYFYKESTSRSIIHGINHLQSITVSQIVDDPNVYRWRRVRIRFLFRYWFKSSRQSEQFNQPIDFDFNKPEAGLTE